MAAAQQAFARSALAVIPTDTVYGIAADAFDPTAVRRLLRAKGRGRDMPSPVLIGATATVHALATNVGPDVEALVDRFWPGGLTVICREHGSLRWDLGDGRGTVAIRMPDQADTLELLAEHGPLAVSSANTTGQRPATTVTEAQEMLGEVIDVYLDAGQTPGAIPSTIVDATGDLVVMVRAGVVSLDDLRAVVPSIEAAGVTDA